MSAFSGRTRGADLFWAGLVGLAALLAAFALTTREPYRAVDKQREAATLMATCERELLALRHTIGFPPDPELDRNMTGLIGPEYTDFTTTLGNLEAKRTATNPAFAALMVRLFTDLGLRAGDVVAVGASGSFPALILATLAAARVLQLEPVLIYSLGSSMYGAGLYNGTFVEMQQLLRERGLLPFAVLAVSLGGGNDRADDLIFPEAREVLLHKARSLGLPFILEPDLAASEARRLALYAQAARTPIRCFVNVGGASVNMGNRAFALRLPNGLVRPETVRSLTREGKGLAAHYLRQGVPVIHLLDIREIALRYGIPFDPVPLPVLGQGNVYEQPGNVGLRRSVLLAGLIGCLWFLIRRKVRPFTSRTGRGTTAGGRQ